ncbi:MAG: hypothetical protein A2666_04485 [Parcubacteria group bacterium RIFCSPHIGHO2_01_FULL_47_10b]|nr:MAG: hypothetical protein A2666_04485 [Parcubacteria group bacterium RIFCSPHIGHO2_01_FULL_47_10b]
MTVESIKQQFSPILRQHHVVRAGIFGSVATGMAGVESDIDVLVEFEPGSSLFNLISLKNDLTAASGSVVDVVTYASVHPKLRERILQEEKRIYER